MRRSLLLILFWAAVCASAQSFRVTPEGRVVSESNCYSFEVPAKWNVRIDGTAPYFVNFSPGKLVPLMGELPKGGAEIGVASALDAHNGVKSIDQWMELERRANSFTSVQEIKLPTDTLITKAIEVSWTQQTTESWEHPRQAVMVFFVFLGQPFRAGVEFNSNDRKKDSYVKTLTGLLESFRPKDKGTPGVCFKSPS